MNDQKVEDVREHKQDGPDQVAVASGSEGRPKAVAESEAEKTNHVGQYSDQHNIDAECEKLLRNTKKRVKQMMEEAVTKKFIHEDSSSIISLCVAVDACLSHGLKRRALGLFKTSSSTALIQKVAKACQSAQEVLSMVECEEKKISEEQQRNKKAAAAAANQQQQANSVAGGKTGAIMAQRSPLKQVASNLVVHKRYMWIKCSLLENKLVGIVEYLAENSTKYYELDALMANYLCAQILSSLLVGPSALEFSRSKTNDYYQFEDPSADELLKRHKLANPIACLCNNYNSKQNHHRQQASSQHNQLSRSVTDNSGAGGGQSEFKIRSHNSLNITTGGASPGGDSDQHRSGSPNLRSGSPNQQQKAGGGKKESLNRRKPLSLKTNVKRGTLVTDCHHYSCQEISEHQHTRGYSFRCTSSSGISLSGTPGGSNTTGGGSNSAGGAGGGCQSAQDWSLWSPRMLHETLHQNPKSCLLYAKNNVLLETQPNETMAGYLSLHQTSSDLILKWIPNQMISGSQVSTQYNELSSDSSDQAKAATTIAHSDNERNLITGTVVEGGPAGGATTQQCEQTTVAVESSYLDLVVSLSVSRIVLLHCQFGNNNNKHRAAPADKDSTTTTLAANETNGTEPLPVDQDGTSQGSGGTNQVEARDSTQSALSRVPSTEETLILVEADGVQRAPFKFPKGGLRLFLSCLESGLLPDKYLDPAIKFDEGCWPDDSPYPSSLDSPTTINSEPPPSAGGRLDSFLRRLPSLKRKSPRPSEPADLAGSTTTTTTSSVKDESLSSRTTSPDQQLRLDNITEPQILTNHWPTNNYVYRIVSSHQQPDWQSVQMTPPLSALSIGSSSSGSFGPHYQLVFHNHHQQQKSSSVVGGKQAASTIAAATISAQKFRWSLRGLARFSAKYTQHNNGGRSTSSSSGGVTGGGGRVESGSLGSSLSYATINQQQTIENNNSICDSNELSLDPTTIGSAADDKLSLSEIGIVDERSISREETGGGSRDLARIEAKLCDLKNSTSDDLLALRTQSIQTLCASMRKQILARAFYGWLIHCRKSRMIRSHLVKLIKEEEKCSLIDESVEYEHYQEITRNGLTRVTWNRLMTMRDDNQLEESDLRLEINQLVYYGGIENDELRKEVWPYLLEHYKFKDSEAKKRVRDNLVREAYESCGSDWIKIERVVKQRDNEILAANMAKASKNGSKSKDITSAPVGTDSSTNKVADSNNNNNQTAAPELDSFDEQPTNESDAAEADLEQGGDDDSKPSPLIESGGRDRMRKIQATAKKRRKRQARLESTGSVGSDASITDQFGNNIHRIDKDVQRCDRNFWYFKEAKNLDKLRNIMCSYVWQHLDVGYVQGMCDLAAPFLVIFDDEILAYSCFSQLMKRMVSNFPHGCAMDQHFESLKYLMQVLDPKVFDVLQSNGDYTHFYFCYRWLLLDFKRELAYEDVYRVWETIWTARYVVTDHFVVFMALAMVRYYRDIIIENNMDFTDTIKFFNEMAERHDAKRILALARDCIVELQRLIIKA